MPFAAAAASASKHHYLLETVFDKNFVVWQIKGPSRKPECKVRERGTETD
jgi:hypothetical protein